MPAFAVTVTTANPQLGRDRTGEVSFTVTNQSSGKIRGRAEIKPDDPTQATWLQVRDAAERDFDPDGVQQFVVRIAVPAGAPGGTCKFQLNVTGTVKGSGEEQSVAGPSVAVAVPPPEQKKATAFPWWIVAVAAGVVLVVVGGVVAWRMTRLPGAGQPCKDGKCAAGLWCPQGNCVADKTGQSCQGPQDCGGQACVPVPPEGKICLRNVGAPCDPSNWAQCASLFCNKDGHCAVSANGASCHDDVQCESGNCQNNVCSPVVTAVACNPPCRAPFSRCQDGRCVPILIFVPRAEINRNLQLHVQ